MVFIPLFSYNFGTMNSPTSPLRLNMNMSSYKYMNFLYEDKTV